MTDLPLVEEVAQRPSRDHRKISERLPDFPWDKLTTYAATARAHPDGVCDLSVGTPVDPTPAVVQEALRAASDSPGYPTTIGLEATRQAAIDWLARRHGVTGLGLDGVLPVIGSKELIGSMAVHLGIGPGDLVGYPALAYPTYEVGAALAGADSLATDSLTAFGPRTPRLLWLNSPANPSGRVLPLDHLRKVVDWCRERGTILVSDECYIECAWEGEQAALDPRPAGQRRLARRHPRRPLAVQALQPRRLPLRLRGRRPGPRRRAARGPQEPRPPDARARSSAR